jgi:hypothetical protein
MATPRTAFRPLLGATVNIDVSSSSQSVSLAVTSKQQVRVMNNGTATAWITFGPGAATATTTAGIPIGPGVTEVLSVEDLGGTLYAAAIAAGSTGKIYFTPGQGL